MGGCSKGCWVANEACGDLVDWREVLRFDGWMLVAQAVSRALAGVGSARGRPTF